MKILQCLPGLEPGGTEWQCARISKILIDLGHEVGIVYEQNPKVTDVQNYLTMKNIPHGPWPLSEMEHLLTDGGGNRKFDIVIGYLYPHGPEISLIADQCHIPGIFVSYQDTGILYELADPKFNKRIPDNVHFVVPSFAVQRGYVNLADNDDANDWILLQHGVEIPQVCTDEERKTLRNILKIPEDAFLIMQRANFKPIKDQLFTVMVAKILVEKHPEIKWRFILAGYSDHGSYGEGYEEMIKSAIINYNLEDYFIFSGPLSNKMICIADIGILTSESEGFPNVLLEFLAAEVPVIARPTGGTIEMFKDWHEGIYAEAPESFARAIDILYWNRKRSKLMAKAGRELASRMYEIGIAAKKWEHLFQTVLRNQKSVMDITFYPPNSS